MQPASHVSTDFAWLLARAPSITRSFADDIMRSHRLTAEHHASVRTTISVLIILGLVGCASEISPTLSSPTTETPYVGVFTGEFVDGLPLYRFPSIQVVGSRRSITPE